MRKWLSELDRILRGEPSSLAAIRNRTLDVSATRLTILVFFMALIYGLFAGIYALHRPFDQGMRQLFATMIKLPALFLLTVVVTLPSLYVFNALVGSRLGLSSVVRLLAASMAVMLAVLASFGPIVAFFSLTTKSYPFMVLLNVALCAVAGALGLVYLLRTLQRLSVFEPFGPHEGAEGQKDVAAAPPSATELSPGGSSPGVARAPEGTEMGALDRIEGSLFGERVVWVFRCWVALFALVGAQMSWVLRPFIGDPNLPFSMFRPVQDNFFSAVWNAFFGLFR